MGQAQPTSAYVHFPWCLAKCPYCDFASAAIRRAEVPHDAYADAVLAELSARDLSGRALVSVFFGGGTPSLWDPAALGRVLAAVRAAFGCTDPIEVTVECNPTSLDADKAARLREVGVNRLSIGVQSLDDARLRFLGRLHDAAGALRALDAVVPVMERVSADLMFGMPGQRAGDFAEELARVLATGVEHVSAYALTIEPDTQFGALHRKGRLALAPEDDFADTFERAREQLAAAGFSHYEVSNHARPGRESQHNLHYWRGGDYLGLGAGAVGALDGLRTKNDPRPERYLAAPAGAVVFEETLSPEDRVREALMLGLRTREGVALDAVRARTGLDPRAGRERAIARRIERGDLRVEGDAMRVPEARWLHLDAIVTDLF
ncbi:MAG: radical SAM family heme chaperone HemW [Sandaracinaceae bacterium]|nr:radical SAM family heme chaperone HemW [Sandaracinaceae bacterium]